MNDVKVGTFTAVAASNVDVELGFEPSMVTLLNPATADHGSYVLGGAQLETVSDVCASCALDMIDFAGEGPLTDLTGTLACTAGLVAVTGTNTLFTTELVVGESIQIDGNVYKVAAIASATGLTLDHGISATVTAALAKRVEPRGVGFTLIAGAALNDDGETITFVAYR